jgi:DNA-binding transcriptional MerR regulator
MYRIQQFADLAGVTVRTLHHYDRLGLLKPRRRTAAGYRLYEDRDLERLEHIVALRFLGLSLAEIRTLLENASDSSSVTAALALQRRLLLEKRRMLDRAIEAIAEAQSCSGAFPALRKIIEVMEMETKNDWMDKYHTEESKAKVEARKHLWSPELQARVTRQWNELIADVEASLEADPASERAQALAARWKALVSEFTGCDAAGQPDKDLAQSVGRIWADRANWPAEAQKQGPAIKPEIWGFIAKANAAKSA